jgi:hypothetical protein
MLWEGLPQGSWCAGSGRATRLVIWAGGNDNWWYKPVWNINATVARNIDDVFSRVFKPTT